MGLLESIKNPSRVLDREGGAERNEREKISYTNPMMSIKLPLYILPSPTMNIACSASITKYPFQIIAIGMTDPAFESINVINWV